MKLSVMEAWWYVVNVQFAFVYEHAEVFEHCLARSCHSSSDIDKLIWRMLCSTQATISPAVSGMYVFVSVYLNEADFLFYFLLLKRL